MERLCSLQREVDSCRSANSKCDIIVSTKIGYVLKIFQQFDDSKQKVIKISLFVKIR